MFTTGSPGSTATAERRRALLLELSREDGPIRRAHPMSFSPEVVEAYRDRGPKTLTRDLNALRKLGLVRLDEGGASWQPRNGSKPFCRFGWIAGRVARIAERRSIAGQGHTADNIARIARLCPASSVR